MTSSDSSQPDAAGSAPLPGLRLPGVALVSASVLLLQLVHTRILSPMLWHHLTYLVVTFTLLGFAAGGALLACKPKWLKSGVAGRLSVFATMFGLTTLASYALITRALPESSMGTAGLAVAAFQYSVLILPMVFGGVVIALALSDSHGSIGRVYAWNMGGSALGCAIYVPVLRGLGGEGAVLFAAAVTFIGAAMLSGERKGLKMVGGVLAVASLVLSVVSPKALFEVPVAANKVMSQTMKLDPRLRVERTAWDPLCRLDVVGPGPDAPNERRTVYQDGDAPTVLPMGPMHLSTDIAAKEGLGYLLFEKTAPKVLAIGIGGGIDILQAKAQRTYPDGSSVDFTGIEINRTTASLMRNEYREATADRYFLPGVTIHVDEGRSWLRRSDEKYDLIQMTGTDTYAALSSGSYVMSESYLYTAEAYDDFISHLTPDGVIGVMRFRFDPPRETLRLGAIAVDALRRDGAETPEQHFVVIGWKGKEIITSEGRVQGLDYAAVLIRKRPFTPREVARYQELCAARPAFFVMYAPGVEAEGEFPDFFAAVAEGTDEAYRDRYLYNLDPVTDNNPFFFRYHKWGNVLPQLFGFEPEQTAPVGADAKLTSDVGTEYLEIIGDKPIGLIMLLTVLGQSILLVALLVLVPLFLFRRDGLKVPGGGTWVLYFMGLGAGYILIEVAAMQRFVLFLGHPGYAITVVLISFLVFSAMGAAVAGKSKDPRRTLARALVAVLLLLAVFAFGLPMLFDLTLKLSIGLRILITVAALGPMAFFMGMPFPSGLTLVQRQAGQLVPWAFGVNGGASVVASVVGILLAMAGGFSTSFAAAGVAYLVALLAGRSKLTAGN